MAAIIAQMTRANRERKRKKRIEISKCMYELPPFPEHFNEQLHNKYMRNRREVIEKKVAENFHKKVFQRLEDIKEEQENAKDFQIWTCFAEFAIIFTSLLLVPMMAMLVDHWWPQNQALILDPGLASSSSNHPDA